MNPNASSWWFLVVIVALHLGGIAFVMSAPEPSPKQIVEPSIQGVLIIPEKKEVVPTPPEPPKQKQEQKKHKQQPKPVPKAPPSERAVKAPEPEPVPVKEPVIEEKPEPMPEAVIPPNTDAYELNNPAPLYPAMSKKLREEGVVLLKILVTKEGRVAGIEIKNSSGFKRLDDAAIKAIKRWKFNPATQGGKAIDYWYEIDFDFSVKKK